MDNNVFEYIQTKLSKNYDIKYRKLYSVFGNIYIIYIEDISDSAYISEYIVEPLTDPGKATEDIEIIKNQVIATSFVEEVHTSQDAVLHILEGDTVILFDFREEVLWCDTKRYAARGIEIPPTETVVKGPREGFNENIRDNISLIRKRCRSSDLKCESMLIGEKSNNFVIIVYIESRAPKKLVEYVKKTIQNQDKDFVLYSNYIGEQLKNGQTLFHTAGFTEKPDILVAKVREGRVGILVDGTPFAVTVPHFFIENFESVDDYTSSKYAANYLRAIRWAGFVLSILMPGLYVALTTHHFNLIPKTFAFRLAVARAGVPYPTFIEMFIMFLFFQILREAGVRLPQPIGSAVSIVGALILGDAAINAGLTSTSAVLLVALASISGYLIPNLYIAISVWNGIIIWFAVFLGLPGFFIGFCVLISHLAGLSSCGYPYLYPLGTLKKFGFKDHLVRADLKKISNNIFLEDENK